MLAQLNPDFQLKNDVTRISKLLNLTRYGNDIPLEPSLTFQRFFDQRWKIFSQHFQTNYVPRTIGQTNRKEQRASSLNPGR